MVIKQNASKTLTIKHSGMLLGAYQFYIKQLFFLKKEYRLKIIKVSKKKKLSKDLK